MRYSKGTLGFGASMDHLFAVTLPGSIVRAMATRAQVGAAHEKGGLQDISDERKKKRAAMALGISERSWGSRLGSGVAQAFTSLTYRFLPDSKVELHGKKGDLTRFANSRYTKDGHDDYHEALKMSKNPEFLKGLRIHRQEAAMAFKRADEAKDLEVASQVVTKATGLVQVGLHFAGDPGLISGAVGLFGNTLAGAASGGAVREREGAALAFKNIGDSVTREAKRVEISNSEDKAKLNTRRAHQQVGIAKQDLDEVAKAALRTFGGLVPGIDSSKLDGAGRAAVAILDKKAHAAGKWGINKVVRASWTDNESSIDREVDAPKNPGWKDQMRDSESDIYYLTKRAHNRPRSNAREPMQRLRSNATEFRNAGGDKRTAADETFIKFHDNPLVKRKAASPQSAVTPIKHHDNPLSQAGIDSVVRQEAARTHRSKIQP